MVTVVAVAETRGNSAYPLTLERSTMPEASKDSAPNVQDAGRVIDRGGDLDDTTVDFVTIRQSHSLAPLLRGLPGQLPVPHWGYLLAREDHRQLRQSRGNLRSGRCLLHDAGTRAGGRGRYEFVQFSPREQLAVTLAAMKANAQRAMQGT